MRRPDYFKLILFLAFPMFFVFTYAAHIQEGVIGSWFGILFCLFSIWSYYMFYRDWRECRVYNNTMREIRGMIRWER